MSPDTDPILKTSQNGIKVPCTYSSGAFTFRPFPSTVKYEANAYSNNSSEAMTVGTPLIPYPRAPNKRVHR